MTTSRASLPTQLASLKHLLGFTWSHPGALQCGGDDTIEKQEPEQGSGELCAPAKSHWDWGAGDPVGCPRPW